MNKSIKILLLEKNIMLGNMLIYNISAMDYRYQISHVTSVDSFIDEVAGAEWDLIISNYSVLGWTAIDTLNLLKGCNSNVPLMVVTEPQTDEVAVECLKKGALDYITYPNYEKIAQSVQRLTKNKRTRSQISNITVEEFCQNCETIFDPMPMPIIIYDEETLKIISINKAAEKYFSYSKMELVNQPQEIVEESLTNMIKFIPKISRSIERINNWRHYKKDGSVLDSEITSYSITLLNGSVRVSVLNDISRKARLFEPMSLRLN